MMRRLLIGSVAAGGLFAAMQPLGAADLAVAPASPPAVVPAFTWTGLYLGGNIGGAHVARGNWFGDPTIYPPDVVFPNGFGCGVFSCGGRSTVTGGAQIGFAWQTGIWVWGLEGDVEALGNTGNRNNGGVTFTLPATAARGVTPGRLALAGGTYTASFSGNDDSSVLGTIRGRLGLAWDRLQVYGTGGVAFRGGNDDLAVSVTDASGAKAAAYGCDAGFRCSAGNTVGWAAGVGGQYAITNHVSLGVEYLHAGFGGGSRIDPVLTAYSGTPTTRSRGDWDVDIVRARLDFLFNGL